MSQGPERGRGAAPITKGSASLRRGYGTAGKIAPLSSVSAEPPEVLCDLP